MYEMFTSHSTTTLLSIIVTFLSILLWLPSIITLPDLLDYYLALDYYFGPRTVLCSIISYLDYYFARLLGTSIISLLH